MDDLKGIQARLDKLRKDYLPLVDKTIKKLENRSEQKTQLERLRFLHKFITSKAGPQLKHENLEKMEKLMHNMFKDVIRTPSEVSKEPRKDKNEDKISEKTKTTPPNDTCKTKVEKNSSDLKEKHSLHNESKTEAIGDHSGGNRIGEIKGRLDVEKREQVIKENVVEFLKQCREENEIKPLHQGKSHVGNRGDKINVDIKDRKVEEHEKSSVGSRVHGTLRENCGKEEIKKRSLLDLPFPPVTDLQIPLSHSHQFNKSSEESEKTRQQQQHEYIQSIVGDDYVPQDPKIFESSREKLQKILSQVQEKKEKQNRLFVNPTLGSDALRVLSSFTSEQGTGSIHQVASVPLHSQTQAPVLQTSISQQSSESVLKTTSAASHKEFRTEQQNIRTSVMHQDSDRGWQASKPMQQEVTPALLSYHSTHDGQSVLPRYSISQQSSRNIQHLPHQDSHSTPLHSVSSTPPHCTPGNTLYPPGRRPDAPRCTQNMLELQLSSSLQKNLHFGKKSSQNSSHPSLSPGDASFSPSPDDEDKESKTRSEIKFDAERIKKALEYLKSASASNSSGTKDTVSYRFDDFVAPVSSSSSKLGSSYDPEEVWSDVTVDKEKQTEVTGAKDTDLRQIPGQISSATPPQLPDSWSLGTQSNCVEGSMHDVDMRTLPRGILAKEDVQSKMLDSHSSVKPSSSQPATKPLLSPKEQPPVRRSSTEKKPSSAARGDPKHVEELRSRISHSSGEVIKLGKKGVAATQMEMYKQRKERKSDDSSFSSTLPTVQKHMSDDKKKSALSVLDMLLPDDKQCDASHVENKKDDKVREVDAEGKHLNHDNIPQTPKEQHEKIKTAPDTHKKDFKGSPKKVSFQRDPREREKNGESSFHKDNRERNVSADVKHQSDVRLKDDTSESFVNRDPRLGREHQSQTRTDPRLTGGPVSQQPFNRELWNNSYSFSARDPRYQGVRGQAYAPNEFSSFPPYGQPRQGGYSREMQGIRPRGDFYNRDYNRSYPFPRAPSAVYSQENSSGHYRYSSHQASLLANPIGGQFTCLILNGLPPYTNSLHIYKFFEHYQLSDIAFELDYKSDCSGAAYVRFHSHEEARNALEELQNRSLREFRVSLRVCPVGFFCKVKHTYRAQTIDRERRLNLPPIRPFNPYYRRRSQETPPSKPLVSEAAKEGRISSDNQPTETSTVGHGAGYSELCGVKVPASNTLQSFKIPKIKKDKPSEELSTSKPSITKENERDENSQTVSEPSVNGAVAQADDKSAGTDKAFGTEKGSSESEDDLTNIIESKRNRRYKKNYYTF